MTDINGIRYYKRKAEYDGDITLNRSLLGEEIDGNFFFLRGYDIKAVGVDKENNLLELERVNGEKLSVDITQEIGDTTLTFNPETGVLHVVTPVSEYDVPGFLSLDTGIVIASDETLKGKGTIEAPLGIADSEKTGMLKMADVFIDMTSDDYVLPTNPIKGYRFVSKENINDFGLLYNYAGVQEIANALADATSEWRVPTRKDWAAMLDSLEDLDPCTQESMHDTVESGLYLGEVAGAKLKSLNHWTSSLTPGTDDYGFAVLPLGYIDPNGSELDDVVGKNASFWTTSEESLKQEIYMRGFSYDTAKVYQGTWDQRAKASLRLVKDPDGANFFENETILGQTMPCVQMPDGSIWTAINVGFGDSIFSGVTSEKWENLSAETKIAYFINDFDGKGWSKKRMTDGQTIVLRIHEDKEFATWRVIGDEFKGLDGVVDLDAETRARINGDIALAEEIGMERNERISGETELRERIVVLENAVSALTQQVEQLTLTLYGMLDTLSSVASVVSGASTTGFTRNVMAVIDAILFGYPKNISVVKVDYKDNITNSLDNTVAFRIKFAPDAIFLADTNYETEG